MTIKPIELQWDVVAKAQSFCCDLHREAFRQMFFMGAMSALAAASSWDPELPGATFFVNVNGIDLLCEELTTAYHHINDDEAGHA